MAPGPYRHRSSATPLAWSYAALIVYASLYPFSDWRWPGVSPWAFLGAPWPRWWTGFDLVSNLLGYVPLGGLLFAAGARSGSSVTLSFARAVVLGSLLSLTMEGLQNYLPKRVSSNLDLGLNAAGALVGASIGVLLHAYGGVERWQRVRDRWFIDRSAGGLWLLLLWPVGLLFPAPLPFGLGQVLPRLQSVLSVALADTTVSQQLESWLEDVEFTSAGLTAGGEFMVTALGVLCPCLVAFAVARAGWRRLILLAGAGGVGVMTTTLSTALNFGPQHALAWASPFVIAAAGFGLLAGLALCWVPRRAAAALGLMALAALVTLVSQAPADPYFADSLQGWEQGRFIRFHGVAQWVGWLWPYAAMAHLLARVAARDAPGDSGRTQGRP